MFGLRKFISRVFLNNFKSFGENNKFIISKNTHIQKVSIRAYGNNNIVKIEDGAYLHKVKIRIGFPDTPVDNCLIKVGKNTSINSAKMQLGENGSSIIIEEECMISFNVEFSCTDTHSIFDKNGKLINVGNNITIGANSWICQNAVILKNSTIPKNSIIAQNSVVTKQFTQENTIIGGAPAKILKENITWDRKRPNYFLTAGDKSNYD